MTLFEDKDVLVLNKPYGLATQGGSGQTRHIDGMLESLAKGDTRPVLVHRLDRDTSGVLLVAKNRRMAADLGEIFRSRQAKKIYWALVEGVPKPAQGRISLYLAKGAGMEKSRGGARELEKMRVAKHGEADAQHSLTYYAIVDKVAPRCAWLSMKPLTGRTHQLRAHAEAIGHPIFGDPKYGHRPEDEVRRRDPLRADAGGARAQASPPRPPAGPAASQGRNARRDRAAARSYAAKLGALRLRREASRPDRGRAGRVRRLRRYARACRGHRRRGCPKPGHDEERRSFGRLLGLTNVKGADRPRSRFLRLSGRARSGEGRARTGARLAEALL